MAKEQKFIYRNQSGISQSLIGYGKVLAGETIETDRPIYNSNFVLVDGGRMVNVELPTKQPETSEKLKSKK